MTVGAWTSIRVGSPRNRQAVVTALLSLGAEAVQELDDDLLTQVRDISRARADVVLRRADPDAHIEFAEATPVDWLSHWRTRIGAHRVGRLVVTPPWLAPAWPAAERIVIEPAMAFGTGEHESTRGVLRLMQHVVRRGDLVADLGAGSGVLAIAAARLGAARVAAIELDEQAIGNAEENVVANGVADCVTVLHGDAFDLLPLLAPVRVVLANIVSSVLVDLAPLVRRSLSADGAWILGGILATEHAELVASLDRLGWRVRAVDEEGQWWSAAFAPA